MSSNSSKKQIIRRLMNEISLRNLYKILRDPSESYKTIRTIIANERAQAVKSNLDYEQEAKNRPRRLADLLNDDVETLREYQSEIGSDPYLSNRFEEKAEELKNQGLHDGTTSLIDAHTMYVICRSLQPDVVVETGCLYGSFDAHIVAALEQNGNGILHTIDLPGGPEGKEYGYLVNEDHRDRWELYLGDSKEVLPALLTDLDTVDLFLHDSLHQKSHMKWEYETAFEYIETNGILASHDVLRSDVFESFVKSNSKKWTTIANLGAAVKP